MAEHNATERGDGKTAWQFHLVPDQVVELLTERQVEIFWLLKKRKTTTVIAREVTPAISPHTVHRHVNAIKVRLRKAGCTAENGYAYKGLTVDNDEPVFVTEPEVITQVEEHHLKQKVRALRREIETLRADLAENETVSNLLSGITDSSIKPTIKLKRSPKKPQVAASIFISDCHFDEVVDPAQIGGANKYNREIAERRLEMAGQKGVYMAQELMSGFDIVHLDLPLGGDMVSGNIHEELARTNESEIMDTVDHWSSKVAELIIFLAGEFPTIYIPCVVGNHGRNTHKPRHKGRVRDNFDWLIYQYTKKMVEGYGAKNVTFEIADSPDIRYETLGHKYLLTHGDQASGGAGWGGIASPIMRLYEKKLKAYSTRGLHFDTMIMGHWHQFLDLNKILVNGTTKGYDEFAHNLNFPMEPPSQAFWLTDVRWGKILSSPLFVADGE